MVNGEFGGWRFGVVIAIFTIMRENILAVKSEEFALRIIEIYRYLQDSRREFIMSKQLLRSGTSIGANIAESVYAQSRPDFVTKLSIALKEANETKYWLSLLKRSEYLTQENVFSLECDCTVLIRMLTSSIKTTTKSI